MTGDCRDTPIFDQLARRFGLTVGPPPLQDAEVYVIGGDPDDVPEGDTADREADVGEDSAGQDGHGG